MPPWIERVVQRVAPLAGWDQLSLTEDGANALRRAIAEAQERGGEARPGNGARSKSARPREKGRPGAVSLFAGPPGPEKLRAAEVLAKELRLNLFRVDLSLVVSSRLEETERILKRLIDGAEEAGGVLFFDGADVMFGKDEQGHDVDRGIAYLLKRAGRYADPSIIAVADKQQMDLVYLRKIRSIVEFGG